MKPGPLYREDFLARHAEERACGEPLRLRSRAVFVAYAALLAAAAIGFATIVFARIRETAVAPAELRASGTSGDHVVFAEFPGHWRGHLRAGLPLRFAVHGQPDQGVTLPISQVVALPGGTVGVRARWNPRDLSQDEHEHSRAPRVGRARVTIRVYRLLDLVRLHTRPEASAP